MEGRCTCGAVRYHLTERPLFVLACHCTWCQRETGSAFALLALIEMTAIARGAGVVEVVEVPSPSGMGQWVRRCSICKVAVWSHYGGAGPDLAFVRVGTLDMPAAFPPQVHCFTSTKQDWLVLDGLVPVEPAGFDDETYWPAESLARWRAMQASRGA